MVGVRAEGQQAVAQPPGWLPGADPGAGASLSPTLNALLRLWGQPAAPASGLAERLGGWMHWRDAIALSQALAAPAGPGAAAALADPQAALDRLRALLQAGFQDPALLQGPGDAAAAFRLHHQQQQRLMAARIAPLRTALRERLRQAAPALARLAALDEVFEQALAAREQQGLAALPLLLLRRALWLQAREPDAAADESSWPPQGWRAQLWSELQRALQAELDLRLQPLLGLLEALHHAPTDPTPT